MTKAEVRNRLKINISNRIGRRKKFAIAIDWPGCINSGAEVTISSDGRGKYIVKAPTRIFKKLTGGVVMRNRYGGQDTWYVLKSKKAALTKAMNVAAPIIKAHVEHIENINKAREAMAKGRPDLAAHYMMENA